MSESMTIPSSSFALKSPKNPYGSIGQIKKQGSFEKLQNGMNAEGLKKACQGFESLFINQLMKEMRETIPKNDLFDGGRAEEIYTSLMDEKFADEISSSGSLGLAKKLYESLSKHLADAES